MSETSDSETVVANAFERDEDPLIEFEPTFKVLGPDAFDLFVGECVQERDLAESTVAGYWRTIDQWREFMDRQDRHEACPSEQHVRGFVDYLTEERDNHPYTIQSKLRRLNEAYEYWQQSPAFPHQSDFNPFALVMSKVSFTPEEEQKGYPSLSVSELRGVIQTVEHIRDRLIILLQFKLGIRASELCNIKLEEIDLQSEAVRNGYPELGVHRSLSGRPNALYVPHDRARNKSCRPRVLPVDDEVGQLLDRYLCNRPDTGTSWLILSKEGHNQMSHTDVNNVWKSAFHPVYEETKHHRAIGSHFGRHFFTTYWRIEQNLDRRLIRYMRGDRAEGLSIMDRAGIDEYIHTYYEDVESIYRERYPRLIAVERREFTR